MVMVRSRAMVRVFGLCLYCWVALGWYFLQNILFSGDEKLLRDRIPFRWSKLLFDKTWRCLPY